MSDFEKAYNQVKNLAFLKNKSEEEVKKIAKKKVKMDDIDVKSMFIDKEEKKRAKELLRKYMDDFEIETISDKNTLKQLIYLEILNTRLQNLLNELHVKNQAIPLHTIDVVHKNLSQIVALKEKLGITRDKLQTQQQDAFKALDLLKKKFKLWLQENQASRTLFLPAKCKHCGKVQVFPILLRIRTDKWEAQKHPFFKDRILGNTHLIRLYKQGKLTKEDLAKIFEVHQDYIDWLVEKWKLNNEKENNN